MITCLFIIIIIIIIIIRFRRTIVIHISEESQVRTGHVSLTESSTV